MSPAVLVGVPWLISLSLLTFSDFDYDSDNICFLYFAVGVFVFQLGYLLVASRKQRGSKDLFTAELNINNKLTKLVVIFEVIAMIMYLIFILKYINSNYIFNIFYTLKLGNENGSLNNNGFFCIS